MKLQIEQPYADAMINQFPELDLLADQLRFGNKALVDLEQLSKASLAFLHDLYENGGPKMQARAAQNATLKSAFNDEGQRYSADDLESLVAGIADFLIIGAMRGWLCHALSSDPARLHPSRRRGNRSHLDRDRGQRSGQDHQRNHYPARS